MQENSEILKRSLDKSLKNEKFLEKELSFVASHDYEITGYLAQKYANLRTPNVKHRKFTRTLY